MWEHLAYNCVAATGLAGIAYASRFLGRPALSHLLWLGVLARLSFPPVYCVTVSMPRPEPFAFAPALEAEPETDRNPAASDYDTTDAPLAPAALAPRPVDWRQWAVGAWAAGSCFLVLHFLGQARRFRRVLDAAPPVGADVLAAVQRQCAAVGLKLMPRVVWLNERLGPCVFPGLRRPTLALPSGLFETLDPVQRDAVIVHELAHLRRGDHWVRWFETASVALFWWHPVVWIARRELRMAEELSCDGWVVATLPAARRAYADALVDTLDFLATTRPALPPLASGFGPVHELRRRLRMILKARPAIRSGRAGAAVALGLGLFLPLSVANSQDREKGPPPRPKAERPEPPPPPRDREGDRGRAGDDENLRREINRLRAELEETQARMMETRQRMERIRNRLADLGVDVPPGPGGPPRGEGRRPDSGPPGRGGRGDGPPPRGEGRRGEGPPRGDRPDAPPPPPPRGEGRRGEDPARSDRPDAPPPPPPPGEGRRPEGGPPRGGPGGPPRGEGRGPEGPRGEGRGGPDRRVQELERQIDELRRELESLRRAPKPPTN